MSASRPPSSPRPGASGSSRRGAEPAHPEHRSHPALLGAMVTSIVLVGVLFVGPFPVRTLWSQHTRAEAMQQQIDVLHAANAKLRTRAKELKRPATIEGLARRDYGMVKKGESAYAILPPPVPADVLPAIWPFVQLDNVTPTSRPAGATGSTSGR